MMIVVHPSPPTSHSLCNFVSTLRLHFQLHSHALQVSLYLSFYLLLPSGQSRTLQSVLIIGSFIPIIDHISMDN